MASQLKPYSLTPIFSSLKLNIKLLMDYFIYLFLTILNDPAPHRFSLYSCLFPSLYQQVPALLLLPKNAKYISVVALKGSSSQNEGKKVFRIAN